MKHLFEPERVEEVKHRMAQLRPDSGRLWGKLDPAQMLAHCSAAIEIRWQPVKTLDHKS